MNYQKHYDSLIERAKMRNTPTGYTERHHIIPRCLGGPDTNENLVRLTAEEHFVAHQLLVKIHPDSFGLRYAVFAMGNETNKRYGWLRRNYARVMRGENNPMRKPSARKKISEALLGRVFAPETIARMSASKTGANHPNYGKLVPEHAKKVTAEGNGMWGKTHSDEVKEILRRSMKARGTSGNPMFGKRHTAEAVAKMKAHPKSEEHRRKHSEAMKAHPVVVCPHCGKEGKGGGMKRYHFDNCISLASNLLKEQTHE